MSSSKYVTATECAFINGISDELQKLFFLLLLADRIYQATLNFDSLKHEIIFNIPIDTIVKEKPLLKTTILQYFSRFNNDSAIEEDIEFLQSYVLESYGHKLSIIESASYSNFLNNFQHALFSPLLKSLTH